MVTGEGWRRGFDWYVICGLRKMIHLTIGGYRLHHREYYTPGFGLMIGTNTQYYLCVYPGE